MRRRTACTILPAATLALVAGPFGGTSYAGTCTALALPPHLDIGEIAITAYGEFRCAEPADGMTVTVCIEELEGTIGVAEIWVSRECGTATATEPTTAVKQNTRIEQVPVYSTWFRTTAIGSNAAGDTATMSSPPAFWFNCACNLG